MSESESDELTLKQRQIEGLISEATEGLTKAEAMIINFNAPDPESEPERIKLWSEAAIQSQITVFELRDMFERLKPLACRRRKEQSWFEFIRWLLWG
jgi:hypothetical protein